MGRAQNDSLGVHSREQRRVLIATAFEKSTTDAVATDAKDSPIDVFAEDSQSDEEVCIICLCDYGEFIFTSYIFVLPQAHRVTCS